MCNFAPLCHEGVTVKEQKCHWHCRIWNCGRKHDQWPTLILSFTCAGSSTHTVTHFPSLYLVYMVHYGEANFSQSFKVLLVWDDLWSGSERVSAGAVWTFWLKEKLGACRLWARKCQGTKDDENISRRQEMSWHKWQERLVLTWGNRFQSDDWEPSMVHFDFLRLDSNLCWYVKKK